MRLWYGNMIILLVTLTLSVDARIHNIEINSDRREIIPLADFGLSKNGYIDMEMSSLIIKDGNPYTYGG